MSYSQKPYLKDPLLESTCGGLNTCLDSSSKEQPKQSAAFWAAAGRANWFLLLGPLVTPATPRWKMAASTAIRARISASENIRIPMKCTILAQACSALWRSSLCVKGQRRQISRDSPKLATSSQNHAVLTLCKGVMNKFGSFKLSNWNSFLRGRRQILSINYMRKNK